MLMICQIKSLAELSHMNIMHTLIVIYKGIKNEA